MNYFLPLHKIYLFNIPNIKKRDRQHLPQIIDIYYKIHLTNKAFFTIILSVIKNRVHLSQKPKRNGLI